MPHMFELMRQGVFAPLWFLRQTATRALTDGATASPVIPVAACESCGGSRRESYFMDHETLSGIAERDCPACKGTGREPVIPVRVLREWAAEHLAGLAAGEVGRDEIVDGYRGALAELSDLLDEHERS
jgi:hypothetical protein